MPIYAVPALLHRRTVCGAFALVALAGAAPAHAQILGDPLSGPAGVTAGGEAENYLRYLQSLGRAPLTTWSLRQFSPRTIDSLVGSDTTHPWAHSTFFRGLRQRSGAAVLPIVASARFNSAYPFGSNDGPVWAGRGATAALQGGVAWRHGPLTAVLDPMVFVAQNEAFRLQPNGFSNALRFADGDFSTNVDRPQRFGDGTYSRFDPGESTIRLDALGVGVGVTTAEQTWGPATTFPVVLGNNAPGIPHFFIGTNHPTNVYIGRAQAQVVYGLEQQSAWSPVTGPNDYTDILHAGRTRFMSGLIATFSPGAIPGLEVGALRFFHQAWLGHISGAQLRTPFEGLVKTSLPQQDVPGIDDRDALKNQLASVFMRWVLPHSGFELYGEYGHEDHNYDTRDLLEEPDHSRIAMAGMRKAFAHADGSFSAVRAEWIDGYAPTLERHRAEGLVYVHNPLRQGHTQDGQLLGADIGVGAPGGAIVAFDSYSASGRTTVFVMRTSQDNFSDFEVTGTRYRSATDGIGTVGASRVMLGDLTDLTVGLAASYRSGSRRTDAAHGWNANLQVAATLHPRR